LEFKSVADFADAVDRGVHRRLTTALDGEQRPRLGLLLLGDRVSCTGADRAPADARVSSMASAS
jgi:hypothetical protein